MARTVGENIRAVLELLTEHGPMTGAQIAAMCGIDREHLGKYCSRAVGLGLATVVHGNRTRVNPSVYTAVVGWEEMADKRRTTRLPRPAAKAQLQPTVWSGVSSVFGVATRC